MVGIGGGVGVVVAGGTADIFVGGPVSEMWAAYGGGMDGLRLGLTAAAVVTAGVGVGTTIPAVRAGMAARHLPDPVWRWLLVDIPIGTVWTEEVIYRGVVGTVATAAFGPVLGRLVQAGIFGLSHISDARATGEPVLGTVVLTGAAGWVFGWLATRSGGLLAPALTHLAINEAGAVAALVVQRQRQGRLAVVRRRDCPP